MHFVHYCVPFFLTLLQSVLKILEIRNQPLPACLYLAHLRTQFKSEFSQWLLALLQAEALGVGDGYDKFLLQDLGTVVLRQHQLVEARVSLREVVRLVRYPCDLEGHLAHAAHRHTVTARSEQQELLLQLWRQCLQDLPEVTAKCWNCWVILYESFSQ